MTFEWTAERTIALVALRQSGVSFLKIGRALGCPEGTAKSKYFRMMRGVYAQPPKRRLARRNGTTPAYATELA